jgi:hypothetical protein
MCKYGSLTTTLIKKLAVMKSVVVWFHIHYDDLYNTELTTKVISIAATDNSEPVT